ncbi:MAG: ketoacyl-ACP synthase III [Deltaproteobacteria bacterium]|nr:ketoacyl-ACP synthase III [Deltaproteobacteria bacterium]
MGHFFPENEITNRFLTDLDIGTNDEWILERVGIRSRRTVLPLDYIRQTKNRDVRGAYEAALYTNAQTGAAAARMALERAGLTPADIGLVVSGSCSPDNLTPAESTTVANELGIDCPCFDLNSACTSFGMQVNFLDRMKSNALPEFVLVVNPDNFTRSIDYSDRRSAVLFGDGSAAAVLSATVSSNYMFSGCYCHSKPASWNKVNIPRLDFFDQDGNAVQGFAIRRTTDSLRTIMDSLKNNGTEGLKFIGHQANFSMLRTVCDRAGIAQENHWYNVVDYGNTGAASAPTVLSQHWDDLRPGDYVAIAQVGAGLTWTHMLLTVR